MIITIFREEKNTHRNCVCWLRFFFWCLFPTRLHYVGFYCSTYQIQPCIRRENLIFFILVNKKRVRKEMISKNVKNLVLKVKGCSRHCWCLFFCFTFFLEKVRAGKKWENRHWPIELDGLIQYSACILQRKAHDAICRHKSYWLFYKRFPFSHRIIFRQ